MRLFMLAAALMIGFAVPVSAGTLSYSEGQGQWQSSRCVAPPIPNLAPAQNTDNAANDLNARITAYNAYVPQADAFMRCIAAEAEADARGTQLVIGGRASEIIKGQQDMVAQMRTSLVGPGNVNTTATGSASATPAAGTPTAAPSVEIAPNGANAGNLGTLRLPSTVTN